MPRLRAPIVVIAFAMSVGSACIDSTSPHFQRPAIAAGATHTCRLATSGLVSCWGQNFGGQLGDGSMDAGSTTPVPLIGGLQFNAIAAGGGETCGIVESGDAYCWGTNNSGQLGDGSTTNSPAPVRVSGGLHFVALSLSGTHACGVTGEWVAYCWGENEDGRLGNGDTTDSWVPIPVAGGLRFRVIAAGGGHTCGITTAGVAYCWGQGGWGQLGGVTQSPVPVALPTTARFTTIASGYQHSCAVSLADETVCWGASETPDGSAIIGPLEIVATGIQFTRLVAGHNYTCGLTNAAVARCWGRNLAGQLGDGSVIGKSNAGLVSGGLTFMSITAGFAHVCGLSGSGATYCWGDNTGGQLGNAIARVLTPTPVTTLAGAATGLSIGPLGTHTCALAYGSALCWGYNREGELGTGSTAPRAVPESVFGFRAYRAVYSGGVHTCALTGTTEGLAHCWGQGLWGQLGAGLVYGLDSVPRVVTGNFFTSLALGMFHTCALTSAGKAYCWGSNFAGERGDSSASSQGVFTPVAVSGGLTFTAIAAGGLESCGLTSAGAAYCWGGNGTGQLGDSSYTSRPFPKPVVGGLVFTTLAIGQAHACGLASSGAAYCWGANWDGRLGAGPVSQSPAPVAVSGGLTFTAIDAGNAHTCALTDTGAAYCWGNNEYGQLGNGSILTTSGVPVAVSGGLSFTKIEAGLLHTCGLTSGGTIYCWGNGYYGQLGVGQFGYSTTPILVP